MSTESSDQPNQRVLSDDERRDQLKLIYDYVKFHLGLYVGTPAALAFVATALDVERSRIFRTTLVAVILILLRAGVDAGLFMGRHINKKWQSGYLDAFEADAFSDQRRFVHHSLYWVAMGLGLSGLFLSKIVAWFRYAS